MGKKKKKKQQLQQQQEQAKPIKGSVRKAPVSEPEIVEVVDEVGEGETEITMFQWWLILLAFGSILITATYVVFWYFAPTLGD